MELLDADTARDYLIRRGDLIHDARVRVQPLAWGVSNVLLRVDDQDGFSLVLKQSRPQLRTQIEWFSRCERIYREADVLRALAPRLPRCVVPRVLFEDRPNFIMGLEAIRPDHVVWKESLLRGELDCAIAQRLGGYLATIHRETCGRSDLLPEPADWSLFDELRIDPFYRYLSRVHPSLQSAVDALIAEMTAHRCCLVHADFSPKNVLVHPDGVALVDFETGHWGDPAFDVGFFLSHILLKSLRWPEHASLWQQLIQTFWDTYLAQMADPPEPAMQPAQISERAAKHLTACLLARIDGKSPVDYLKEQCLPNFVRRFTAHGFATPPASVDATLDRWRKAVANHAS